MPPEVLALTAGVDVQGDRLEMTSIGWTADGAALALAHEIAWGSPLDAAVWIELDDLLLRRFRHPNGGNIGYDAALIDSGDGGTTDAVHAFCRPRIGRRIFALKGMAGFQRPTVTVSPQKSGIFAMRNWSPIRPQVANYETPLLWAMAHVQSGGDVALAIYSARQGEKLGIVAAVFDTEEPIIPAGALVRIAIYLGDLLLPVLTRAEALRIRKVQ